MKKYFLLLSLGSFVDSLRILTVFPSTTRSHYLSVRPILVELLKRGHEIVSISPFEEESRMNYTWIEVEVKTMFEAVPNLKEEFGQDFSFYGYLNFVWRTMNTYVTYITKQPKLAMFIKNDTSKFDLIFAHDFFQPFFYAFAEKYKAPLVVYSSFGHAGYIQNYMGGHFDFTIPHEFSNLEYPLNFFSLIRNVCYILYDAVGRKINVFGYQNSLVEELFGYQRMGLEELERNIDLVLVNSYYTNSVPRAKLSNIVEVGGVHIEDPKPLNQELQDILDGAVEGAILLSLGSFIELNSQRELVSPVLTVLGSLKQRVIVKWNANEKRSKYPNIYLFPWLPLSDVLAHPNMKLFITHGGTLSNHEAVFHGVPVICIPFQATQHQVCQTSVNQGYAIHLSKDNLVAFNESIQKIITDNGFKKNALEASRKFKDRPEPALTTACNWIEFFARKKSVFKKTEDSLYMPGALSIKIEDSSSDVDDDADCSKYDEISIVKEKDYS